MNPALNFPLGIPNQQRLENNSIPVKTPTLMNTNPINPSPNVRSSNSSSQPTYNTLLKLIQLTNQEGEILESLENGTLLAPDDNVFSKLNPILLDKLVLKENREILKKILNNHIIPTNKIDNELAKIVGVRSLLVPTSLSQDITNLLQQNN